LTTFHRILKGKKERRSLPKPRMSLRIFSLPKLPFTKGRKGKGAGELLLEQKAASKEGLREDPTTPSFRQPSRKKRERKREKGKGRTGERREKARRIIRKLKYFSGHRPSRKM